MAFLQANAFHCSHQWLFSKGLFGTSLYHRKNYNFMASVPGCFRFLSLSTLMSLARFVTEGSHFYWMTFRCSFIFLSVVFHNTAAAGVWAACVMALSI